MKDKPANLKIRYRWRVSSGSPCLAQTRFRGENFLGDGDTWAEARATLILQLKRFAQAPPDNETITLESLQNDGK
jgi:hypothetical protein